MVSLDRPLLDVSELPIACRDCCSVSNVLAFALLVQLVAGDTGGADEGGFAPGPAITMNGKDSVTPVGVTTKAV